MYVFSSVKKVEKDDEDERRPKRMLSPTLPDGDLPSYMKATESYFKKVWWWLHWLHWLVLFRLASQLLDVVITLLLFNNFSYTDIII